jgi:hypothetical protein
MDQLKQVGQFIWKWRFWFVLGIVVIAAGTVQPLGTEKVKAMVQRRKSELDAALNQIRPFTMGEHPNDEWQKAIKTIEAKAQEDIGKVQNTLYEEQAKRFVWPAVVAEKFNGRPFNTPLDDDNGRYLFTYAQDFPNEIKRLTAVVDPITLQPDGTVTGKVVMFEAALERPKFDDTPKSQPVWLAQEQIWIQQAVLEAIRRINDPSKDWYAAPIKQVVSIRLGPSAIDVRRLAERAGEVPLMPPTPIVGEATASLAAPAAPPAAGGQDASGNVAARYLEINPEGRTVPVSIALLVDQRRIPEVIAGIEQIEFGFILREVGWNTPGSRINPPAELEEFLNVAPGVSKEAVDHTVQLVAFGDMFIREMPATVRQAWDAKRQQLLNPQAAPPADGSAPTPPGTPPADPNAPPAPTTETTVETPPATEPSSAEPATTPSSSEPATEPTSSEPPPPGVEPAPPPADPTTEPTAQPSSPPTEPAAPGPEAPPPSPM